MGHNSVVSGYSKSTEILRVDGWSTVGPKRHVQIYELLPKEYCLIPTKGAIKLVGPDQSVYTSYNTIAQKIII